MRKNIEADAAFMAKLEEQIRERVNSSDYEESADLDDEFELKDFDEDTDI